MGKLCIYTVCIYIYIYTMCVLNTVSILMYYIYIHIHLDVYSICIVMDTCMHSINTSFVSTLHQHTFFHSNTSLGSSYYRRFFHEVPLVVGYSSAQSLAGGPCRLDFGGTLW